MTQEDFIAFFQHVGAFRIVLEIAEIIPSHHFETGDAAAMPAQGAVIKPPDVTFDIRTAAFVSSPPGVAAWAVDSVLQRMADTFRKNRHFEIVIPIDLEIVRMP